MGKAKSHSFLPSWLREAYWSDIDILATWQWRVQESFTIWLVHASVR
jgi:hypothetical protein